MFIAGRIEFGPEPINLIIPARTVEGLLPYNCIRCKSFLLNINRDVAAIWMGEGYPVREIPKGMGWVQLYCKGCKRFYNMWLQ